MSLIALQVKTSYSMLTSLNDIKKLVSRAKELEYTSLAITDTNNMFGVIEFYLECKKNNIKPIIGIELAIKNKKILLYAVNNDGYHNLIKLSTLVSDRELEISDLDNHKDNLILIMPFNYYDEDIYNLYKNKYIGYSNISDREKIDTPRVFINDVSYLMEKDYVYLDYLIMIRDSKVLGDCELNKHIGKHLLNKDELELICDAEDKKNMQSIVDLCNVEIGYTKDLLPVYDENIDAFSYLSSLCNKGLKRRLNNEVSDEYQKRLDYELNVINEMGFCNYFLIVWDYVKYAKFNNILVGPGRGSAAGSLVSYTLGITDIDPIKYDLLFERFLNPERITMPDIDIDFDSVKRNDVIEYVMNKYGEKKVAGIITFNTLGAKQVIRDVARVMNISLTLVDELSKSIKTDNLKESYQKDTKFKSLIDSSSSLKRLYEIAIHLEGLPRHISIHAAGIVMCRYDIDNVIPLYKNQLGIYTTAYSKDYLENLGLLKMDFLGLDNLTLIDNVITKIREEENLNITFDKIPLDDSKTLNIFKDVKTDGIFQFESQGIKNLLKKLKITTFEDIVLALALYRPGPMANIDTLIKRRNGKEKIEYLHPVLEKILNKTYGIIIYQEQIMQIARVLAGYSYGEADILRRAMSKKNEKILLSERPKFIGKCIENGYEEDLAVNVYNLILKFANYGFNRSHSVGYAIIAYKMAYLKTYFPTYFITCLLTNAIGNDYKTKTYLYEARQRDIKILLPDINLSSNKYIATKNTIRCPLSIVRNVGVSVCSEIMLNRQDNLYKDFIDFVKRNYSIAINRKVIASLIYAGCFSSFGYNKKTLITNLDNIINYAEISKDAGLIEIAVPLINETSEYTHDELVKIELETFGFYLSEHPLSKYRKTDDINLQVLSSYFNRFITIKLLIDKIREVTTKNNDVMAFVIGSDEFLNVSLTLFPKVYSKYNDIKVGDIVEVSGRVEKRYEQYQIVVNTILKL